jgi:hypothetical protein
MAAVMSAGIGLGSYAYADPMMGKTRAQVHEELIEAQRSGLRYVTDVSYPEISAVHAGRVGKRGADTRVASAREPSAKAVSSGRAQPEAQQTACQGPISFCSTYFGS